MISVNFHNPQSFDAGAYGGADGERFVALNINSPDGMASILVRGLSQAKDLAAAANHAVQLAEETFKEEIR